MEQKNIINKGILTKLKTLKVMCSFIGISFYNIRIDFHMIQRTFLNKINAFYFGFRMCFKCSALRKQYSIKEC